MNAEPILQNWSIPGPWQLSSLPGGTNNLIWRVKTLDEQAYVLRLIPDLTQLPRLRREAQLLQTLAASQPPFQLPVLLKTRAGEIAAQIKQTNGETALATLVPLLPGQIPDRSVPEIASQGARALAWLDRLLATLPKLESLPGQTFRTYGELAFVHPLVPNPLAAIERLPIEREQRRRVGAILEATLESVPSLYLGLPQQFIHGDYSPSNILVHERKVTAILDFEFTVRDLRALELCVALSWWPLDLFGSGQEWRIINAFGAAYQACFPLSEPELLALPALWQLRDMTSLIHRLGRFLARRETEERISQRIAHTLWRADWLSANKEMLVKQALQWSTPTSGGAASP